MHAHACDAAREGGESEWGQLQLCACIMHVLLTALAVLCIPAVTAITDTAAVMCLCTCMCMCMCMWMCMCMCVCTCGCACACACVCVHVDVDVHVQYMRAVAEDNKKMQAQIAELQQRVGASASGVEAQRVVGASNLQSL